MENKTKKITANKLHLTMLIIAYIPTANCMTLYVESGKWSPITEFEIPDHGYGAAIAIQALENAGYVVNYKELPWKRVISNLENNQADIALAASINKERISKFIFSNPYIWEDVAIYFLTSQNPPNRLAEIPRGKIAIGRNYSFGEKIDGEIINKSLETNNIESMFNMLLSGRVDFVIEYVSVAKKYIETMPIKNSSKIAQPCRIGRVPLHIMVRPNLKNAELLIKEFNASIIKIMQDGQYYSEIKYINSAPICSNYFD